MKKTLVIVIFSTVVLFDVCAMAHQNVVVIPMRSQPNDPNLVPENICSGVTILGVTGTGTCPPHNVFSTVTSAGGLIWMDRNLGASRVATSSTDSAAYGYFYQWGRLTDGHESRTSPATTTLSTTDVPGHGNFIEANSSPADWRTPKNDSLWQSVSGINNPCPSGFRLPTAAEWEAERASWSSNDAAGAFASPLKLPLAGARNYLPGSSIGGAGSNGNYWSSTVDGFYSSGLNFGSSSSVVDRFNRANGFSVRCIKD